MFYSLLRKPLTCKALTTWNSSSLFILSTPVQKQKFSPVNYLILRPFSREKKKIEEIYREKVASVKSIQRCFKTAWHMSHSAAIR